MIQNYPQSTKTSRELKYSFKMFTIGLLMDGTEHDKRYSVAHSACSTNKKFRNERSIKMWKKNYWKISENQKKWEMHLYWCSFVINIYFSVSLSFVNYCLITRILRRKVELSEVENVLFLEKLCLPRV